MEERNKGKGCGKNYKLNELFCREAKRCFNTISSIIIKKEVSLVSEEDKVVSLLQIIKIPA